MEMMQALPSALSLAAVIGGLRERVAAWGGRKLLETALVLLLHRRLGEIGRRIERMVARFRAGTLVRREAAAARDRAAASGAAAHGARIWPVRFGWLVIAGRHEAALYTAQLRAILAEPEMVALLKAAPQAMRVLRPLCRALAIETDELRPGVARVAPEAKPVPAKRVRKPRVKIDLGRIPLPRGVLAAVRREGYFRKR